MYGANPCIFANFEAVKKVAEAYSMEENTNWIIVKKTTTCGVWFKPVSVLDLEIALADGYEELAVVMVDIDSSTRPDVGCFEV